MTTIIDWYTCSHENPHEDKVRLYHEPCRARIKVRDGQPTCVCCGQIMPIPFDNLIMMAKMADFQTGLATGLIEI